MTNGEAIVLGLVQGLTEFLPVSSSGHLVLFQQYLGINQGVLTFDIAVHVATLVAVFIVFWSDIVEILKKPWADLPLLVVIGTIPAVAFGFLFKDFIEKTFTSGHTLGYEFILTGIVLFIADRIKTKERNLSQMSWIDASLIGVGQAIAILPAISRSGLTIASGLMVGLQRSSALRFSFLLSIPAILGGAVFDLKDVASDPQLMIQSIGLVPLLVGMAVAGVSGYLTIRFMLRIFSRSRFTFFSLYVIAVGVFVIIDQNVHVIK